MQLNDIRDDETAKRTYEASMICGAVAVMASKLGFATAVAVQGTRRDDVQVVCPLVEEIKSTVGTHKALKAMSQEKMKSYAFILRASGADGDDYCRLIGRRIRAENCPVPKMLSSHRGQWMLGLEVDDWFGRVMVDTVADLKEEAFGIEAIAEAVLITGSLTADEVKRIIAKFRL